jgi:acetyl esterase/lipase
MSNIPEPQTFVYSTVGNLEVKLDLYVPPNATGTLPAIICFHAGALTVGDRHMGHMNAVWLLGSFDRHTCLEPKLIRTFQSWPQLMG